MIQSRILSEHHTIVTTAYRDDTFMITIEKGENNTPQMGDSPPFIHISKEEFEEFLRDLKTLRNLNR